MRARSGMKNLSAHSSPIRMLRLRRADREDDFLKGCHQLREEELYTDMTIVTGDHKMVKVHSIMFASCSSFLRQWMKNNPVPDGQYSVVLPSATATDVSLVIGLLYGAKLSLRSRLAKRIQEVAEMLGIYIDLTANLESTQDDDRTMITTSNTTLTTMNTTTPPLPLCCWHCDHTFGSFEELRAHVDETHQGERVVASRRHKCSQCKKVLPTTWKLRQHLLTHRVDQGLSNNTRANTDHPYAVNNTNQKRVRSVKKSNQAVNSDHIYSAMASPPRTEEPFASNVAPTMTTTTATTAIDMVTGAMTGAPVPEVASTGRRTETMATMIPTTKSSITTRRRAPTTLRASSSSFSCEQCGKLFPQRYRLARHMKEVHEQEKRHACRFCDKQFFKITSKARHELTHSKHSRWTCRLCDKSFRDESGLRYHNDHRVCSAKRIAVQGEESRPL